MDFGRLSAIMEQISGHEGMLLVHSEDDEMVHYNYSQAKERGEWDWWNMHHIHSSLSEDVSFRRVLRLAERKHSPIYFVHVSAKEGVYAISEARQKGLPVYGETLHNYISFNAENYREKDGMRYHTYPSLKSEEDRKERVEHELSRQKAEDERVASALREQVQPDRLYFSHWAAFLTPMALCSRCGVGSGAAGRGTQK